MKKYTFFLVIFLFLPLLLYAVEIFPILSKKHSYWVTSVAFSPDETMIASASKGEIELYSIYEGKLINTISAHSNYVTSIEFSNDGEFLASGSWDKNVNIWKVSDGSLILKLIGHSDYVTSIAFSLDSQIIASASMDKTIRLWRLSNGKLIKVLEKHSDYITSICFSPDGKLLASASLDKKIIIWQVDTGNIVKVMTGHSKGINAICFNFDGKLIASGSEDNTVKIWDVDSGKSIQILDKISLSSINSISFSPDGNFIAFGNSDGLVKFWNISKNKLVNEYLSHKDNITSVVYSPSGRYLATGSYDSFAKVWDLEMIPEIKESRDLPANLITEVKFYDAQSLFPNNLLDAAEEANLIVTIKNDGDGTAYNVKLEIDCNNPYISFSKDKDIGDIPPKDAKTVSIPLAVHLDATNDIAIFLVQTKEKRGYDAQKQKIQIPVNYIDKPKFEITSIEINDKMIGRAIGNGNGIPENDETIELIAFLKNYGLGKSLDTKLELVSINSNIQIIERVSSIGTIQPNETVKAKVIFHIPRTFTSQSIDYILKVTELRGADEITLRKSIPIVKNQPVISYTIQYPETIYNGNSTDINIIVENIGKLTAKGVVLKVTSSDNIAINNSIHTIGQLEPTNKTSPKFVSIVIPRNYKKTFVNLTVDISQTDFPAINKIESLPVQLISPKLDFTDMFIDRNGNGKIEQGETIEIIIIINNKGELFAEEVELFISSTEAKVNLAEKKLIGIIPANAQADPVRFIFTVPRGISLESLPINVIITQKDFPSIEKKLNYQIYKDDVNVTTISKQKEINSSTFSDKSINSPPIILPNLKDNYVVYIPQINLLVSVSDDRGIASTEAKLNGIVVYNSNINDPQAIEKLKSSKGKLFNFELILSPFIVGNNEIIISAIDTDNEKSEMKINLIYNPPVRTVENLDNPSDVDINFPIGKKNPNGIAVIIGISDYANIPDALYADRDAIAMESYIISTLGYSKENVITLINNEATFGKISGEIFSKLKNRILSNESEVFIYFSGHGIPTESKKGYLASYDFEPGSEEFTAIELNKLYSHLENLPVKSAVVIIDACFTGESRSESVLFAEAKPGLWTIEGPGAYKKLGILTSSAMNQISLANNDKKHGLFTYYLLKGLQGEGDTNKDKVITLEELSDYLSPKVLTDAKRQKNKEQIPQLNGQNKNVELVRFAK